MRFYFSVTVALIISLVLAVPAWGQSQSGPFPDVPGNHPYAASIETLKGLNLVSGFGDGTFKPDQTISRAEATAILLKTGGISVEKTAGKAKFSDVPESAWFFSVIQKAALLKKIKGYDDGTFRPGSPVTLPEALALSASFLNLPAKETPVEPFIYKGFDAKAWYGPYVQYAKNMYLITPPASGKFDVTAGMTRGEFAQLVARSRTIAASKQAFDITASWTTTEHLENFWKLKHPASWNVFKGSQNSVIWKPGPASAFFTRVWPRSARLSISVTENPENLTPQGFFDQMRREYADQYEGKNIIVSPLTLGGRLALRLIVPEERLIDTYIHLPNGKFLTVFGEYGKAPIAEYYKKELELVIASYHYVEKPPEPPRPVIPLEDRLQTQRLNILIEGGWQTVADLFPDKKLIHTDALGVGTGPVDYFFTAEAGQTIKVERNSKTILNVREGSTSAF